MQNIVGVIGGSGLYQLDTIKDLKEEKITTPYGPPSANPMVGTHGETKVVFIPRHGKGHVHTPSEVNYRANIYAMKALGVRWLLTVSAVGSMKEKIEPGHMVIVDQYIDRTKDRPATFFGEGIVGHVSFGDPVCNLMVDAISEACKAAKATYHKGGTYLCMEGPAFSTRAESKMYRTWGVDVIGMTNLIEAKLAREAEICFGSVAMATDYDCWYEGQEIVNAHAVMETFTKNVATAKNIVGEFLRRAPTQHCPHQESLKHSIVTERSLIPAATKEKTKVLFGKYLG